MKGENGKMRLILTSLLLVNLLMNLDCVNPYSEPTIVRENGTIPENKEFSSVNPKTEVINSTIEFYGWWWSDSQFEHGIDIDTPKEGYLKIESWNAGDGYSPHPDKLDINCSIENKMAKEVRLSFILKVDFKVDSYRNLSRLESEQKVKEKLESISWKNEVNVGRIGLTTIPVNEMRTISFKDFDIGSILQKYFESHNDDWAWKLRAKLYIYNEKGEQISKKEKIMDLIPGD